MKQINYKEIPGFEEWLIKERDFLGGTSSPEFVFEGKTYLHYPSWKKERETCRLALCQEYFREVHGYYIYDIPVLDNLKLIGFTVYYGKSSEDFIKLEIKHLSGELKVYKSRNEALTDGILEAIKLREK